MFVVKDNLILNMSQLQYVEVLHNEQKGNFVLHFEFETDACNISFDEGEQAKAAFDAIVEALKNNQAVCRP